MFAYLLSLSVAGLGGLVLLLLGEANAEDTEKVSVSGLNIDVSLDESLPLLDHGPPLVSGQVHSVEVAQAVLALNILADQLELAEGPLCVGLVLEISQRDLIDASLQTVRSDPEMKTFIYYKSEQLFQKQGKMLTSWIRALGSSIETRCLCPGLFQI